MAEAIRDIMSRLLAVLVGFYGMMNSAGMPASSTTTAYSILATVTFVAGMGALLYAALTHK